LFARLVWKRLSSLYNGQLAGLYLASGDVILNAKLFCSGLELTGTTNRLLVNAMLTG
jgi:hypothetical protein